MLNNKIPILSVIVPVYNNEDTISELASRIDQVCQNCCEGNYELLLSMMVAQIKVGAQSVRFNLKNSRLEIQEILDNTLLKEPDLPTVAASFWS